MAVILSISSHVVRGHVGNQAATFALERLGHTVWPLATVTMPHHPGHGRDVARLVTPAAMIADFIVALGRQGWLSSVDALLAGYVGKADQAPAIADAARRVRAANPAAVVMVDPIIGDDGSLYVGEAIAKAVRDTLLPVADIAVPNLFELGWLTGRDVSEIGAAIATAREMGLREIVVTSAPGAPAGHIRTLAVTEGAAFAADSERIATSAHGAGDLLAALYLGRRLLGETAETALARATGAVRAVLAETARRHDEELALIDTQDRLVDSQSALDATRVG